MTTPEPNLRMSGAVDADDEFADPDPISIEHVADDPDAMPVRQDGADLLFTAEEQKGFTRRWTDVQTRFVDDPREAVAAADDLVGEVMAGIDSRLARRCSALGQQWAGDDEPDTEDLRLALQRYRAFFQRLLSI
ncbi:MAG: hypothetical protein AB1679_07890 [Actinomycetota bacterium]|jgi:glutathione S-transferase